MVTCVFLNATGRAGLDLTVKDGGRIEVKPKDKITTTIREIIRENKAELLAALSIPAPCRDCTRIELVEYQGGKLPGCLYEIPGEEFPGWRRFHPGLNHCIWGGGEGSQSKGGYVVMQSYKPKYIPSI